MERKQEILQRFLRYVKTNTMSRKDNVGKQHPTTPGQWDLLRLLEAELKGFGIKDVSLDENGYVIANIPGNKEGIPSISFSAHVDTADDVEGDNVKPRVIENYDGGDIRLNESVTLSAKDNPELASYKGETLIVTDGTTLLGSDDKAGITEIMVAVKTLCENPEIKHGPIQIFFTPDEETGTGMDYFPMKAFNSECCYTIDGGTRYEIECECFNASTFTVTFKGVSYHLGSARGRFVNAVTMASAFVSAMPQAQSPEATDQRYGYYCPLEISGIAAETKLTVYLRDFDYDSLIKKAENLEKLARGIEALYGGQVITANKVMYHNMVEASNKKPFARQAVYKAGELLGQSLHEEIIRGGTDGAHLAANGIPCPNIYTGGHNLHGVYEWAALPAMVDATELILKIIAVWAKEA
ncbi:MAG: peptidase T [Sphaerochaetaceae bacterium]|jgi:tripeptide aminopeptidase|nr:peptidase T [Sphaerochaetaceae bacterium]